MNITNGQNKLNKKPMKTIEEAAEEFFRNPYKEEEYTLIDYIKFGAKWQEKNSYSEEDMKYAYEQGARLALISQSPLALHKGEFPTPQEWINEFNK